MSFFGKLKSKLFKSSSKLDEGLDAIVSDGGAETPTPATTSDLSEPAERVTPPEAPELIPDATNTESEPTATPATTC